MSFREFSYSSPEADGSSDFLSAQYYQVAATADPEVWLKPFGESTSGHLIAKIVSAETICLQDHPFENNGISIICCTSDTDAIISKYFVMNYEI